MIAYHLLVSIQTELRKHNIHMRWERIREQLSNHTRVRTGMTNRAGKRIYFRKCLEPEPFHKAIYNALGISYYPIGTRRVEI